MIDCERQLQRSVFMAWTVLLSAAYVVPRGKFMTPLLVLRENRLNAPWSDGSVGGLNGTGGELTSHIENR